jgi:hypothetical protein
MIVAATTELLTDPDEPGSESRISRVTIVPRYTAGIP